MIALLTPRFGAVAIIMVLVIPALVGVLLIPRPVPRFRVMPIILGLVIWALIVVHVEVASPIRDGVDRLNYVMSGYHLSSRRNRSRSNDWRSWNHLNVGLG